MATKASRLALAAASKIDSSGNVEADTLDGIDSLSFTRSDQADTITGRLTVSDAAANSFVINNTDNTSTNHDILTVTSGGGGGFAIGVQDASQTNPVWNLRTYSNESIAISDAYNEYVRFDGINNRVGIGTVNPQSTLHIGDATSQFEFATINAIAGQYSGIKLARGAGDWSAIGHNNYMMLVTDNGWEVAKTTSKGNNATGRSTYLKVDDDEVNVENQFGFARLSSDPVGKRSGQVYYNTTDNILRYFDGSQWSNINKEPDPTTGNAFYRSGFNNNFTNSGTGSQTGSGSGSYSFTTSSKIGTHALDFGTNQSGYADFGSCPSTNNYTVGGWFYIYRGNTVGRTYIVDFRTGNSSNSYWLFDNLNSMTIKMSSSETIFSHTIPTNQWVHWVYVSDFTNNSTKFYENGTLVHSGNSYGDTIGGTATLGTYFGARGGSGHYFMNGKVDNFFITQTSYTEAEITALYNSQVDY